MKTYNIEREEYCLRCKQFDQIDVPFPSFDLVFTDDEGDRWRVKLSPSAATTAAAQLTELLDIYSEEIKAMRNEGTSNE